MLTLQNQAHKRLPWFLILRTQQPKRTCANPSVTRPLLFTTCKLGDLSTRHVHSHTTGIQELHGTWILTSMYGWLPNSRSSLICFLQQKLTFSSWMYLNYALLYLTFRHRLRHWFACCFLYAATFLMRSFGFVYVAVENLHWPRESMGRKSMGNFMVQVLLLMLYSSMDNGLVFIRWMIPALLMLWVEVGSSWIHQRPEEMTCMEMPKQCRKWSRMVAKCLCLFIMLLGM